MKAWIGAHRRWVLGGGAAVAAVAVAGIVVAVTDGSDGGADVPPTRARAYTEQQACLLTPERGLADASVGPVWAGMQDASVKTHAKVSYLAVAGEQSAGNAAPYLATLASRKCTVVLTVGAAPRGAVALDGPKFPKTRFLVVEGTGGAKSAGANVKVLASTGDSGVRGEVASAVESALQG
ncbi:BMP family ABC transporter substrate-binding protein [Streptomyces sp. NPDC048696]|uniref:BMP family ABC transporter substrate-binding protein n=1 Tax=Streptomyces sp. NPDC048696 TaxID=3365585 RepID=UPI003717E087